MQCEDEGAEHDGRESDIDDEPILRGVTVTPGDGHDLEAGSARSIAKSISSARSHGLALGSDATGPASSRWRASFTKL